MSLYHLQRRVDALKHRMPVHYTLARLRPYAEQFCDDWEWAVRMGYQPPRFRDSAVYSSPVSMTPRNKSRLRPFMDRVLGSGFHSGTWIEAGKYLDRCLEEGIYPHPDDFLRILLPRATLLELIPPSPDPVTYPAFTKLPPSIPNESLDPLPFLASATGKSDADHQEDSTSPFLAVA